MHAIRKGQVRWVAKGDPVGQRQFIHTIFGVAGVALTGHVRGSRLGSAYLQQNLSATDYSPLK